jgi:hypothetical protein
VNLVGATNVTVSGLLKLAQSDSMMDIGFSAEKLTQDDLLQIIRAVRHITRISLVEPSDGQLDAPALQQAAQAKNIELYAVRKQGVFSNVRRFP